MDVVWTKTQKQITATNTDTPEYKLSLTCRGMLHEIEWYEDQLRKIAKEATQ